MKLPKTRLAITSAAAGGLLLTGCALNWAFRGPISWDTFSPASSVVASAWNVDPSRDEALLKAEMSEAELNLLSPTMGGMWFWFDRRVRDGWRLQENVFTGHWRLLSPQNWRVAWGQPDAMKAEWTSRVAPHLEKAPEQLVVCIHGMLGTTSFFKPLARYVERRAAKQGIEAKALLFRYPSGQVSIEKAARALDEVLAEYPADTRLTIVAHSMGGLVTRYWMQHRAAWAAERMNKASQITLEAESAAPTCASIQPVSRLITLGTPHQGAFLADLLGDNPVFPHILGPAGQELRPSGDFIRQLEWPDVPVYAMAGELAPYGYFPLIPENNDGIVEVSSALPSQAVAWKKVPLMHALLVWHPTTARWVTEALKEGAGASSGTSTKDSG